MGVSGMNHMTFATSDLERSIGFYQKVLGCKLIATWQRGAYLLAGDQWLCLSLDEKTKNKPLKEYSHIALQVEQHDYETLVSSLKHHGVVVWKENKSEGDSFYFLDPDHNKLELHCNSLEERLSYMRQHPYPDMKFYV